MGFGMVEETATQCLDKTAFARSLGIPVGELPVSCIDLIDQRDFEYKVLSGDARDAVILGILQELGRELPRSGPDRLGRWEQGWSENFDSFVASGFDPNALFPSYFAVQKDRRVMRLFGEFVLLSNPSFETDYLAVLHRWIACSFLETVDTVYEFGCGPGHNLLGFASAHPDKTYWGLDWATASQRIVGAIQEAGLISNLKGRCFDMFNPDASFNLTENSAVVTIGAMEQLGTKFGPFLDYLMEKRPVVCIHVEPIVELYDQSLLFDYLGARYAEQRGYLLGLLPALEDKARQGRIELLHVQKNIGSIYHDGWCTVVWKPVRKT